MNARASGNFLHVEVGLGGIAMRQHKYAGRSLAPDLELIAPTCATAALSQFFKRDMLAAQILPDKNGGLLDILPFVFNAEGIVTSGKREKEGGTTAGKGIKYPEPFGTLRGIVTGEQGYVEHYMRKDFIGLPLITSYFCHLQGHKGGELWLQRA